MKRGIKLVVIATLVLILISSVYAAQYGKGRYNIGSYGQGEEEDGGGVSGGAAGPKTSGGSIMGSGSSFSLQTPDDLEDGISSNSNFNCATGTCTVKVKEVAQEGLPNSVTVSVGGIVLGSIQLECTGEVGTSTTTFTINNQEGLSCDNINVEKIKDDGTKDEVDFQCSSSDSGLTVTATYAGCSYLVLSKTEGVQTEATVPTTPETTSEEQPKPVSLTSDTVPITTDLIGKGGIIGIIVSLIVLMILIAVVFVIKKKKAQNVQPNIPVTQSYQYQTQTQQVQQPVRQQTFSQQATTNYSQPVAQTQVK